MTFSTYCYNPLWRQHAIYAAMQTIQKHPCRLTWEDRYIVINTAEDLLAADLDDEEEHNDAFSALSDEQQLRYFEIQEKHCPFPLPDFD